MARPLHIAIAQINPIVGNIEYNLRQTGKAWDAAPAETDLVVFPELSVCGYAPEDMISSPSFLETVKKAVKTLAKESGNRKPWIIVGAPLFSRGKIFNAAHLIGDGKIQATVKKHHLPNYGVFDEARWFFQARMPKPVEFRGHKIGLIICEDMWNHGPAAALKKNGAELLISINASPYDFQKHEQRLAEMRLRVKETGLPLIYVNQCGAQDDLVFDGSSFAMAASGAVVWQGSEFDECLHTLTYPFGAAPAAGSSGPRGRIESIYSALCAGLRDYVGKNGFSGVLLGLSGGIDSALTAAIATDALGRENVHAVFMPSKYTSSESAEDARAIAQILNIKMETISIENQVESFEKELDPHFTAQTPDITFQNIQSRCRGIVLMALSNATGKMVVSTGNKSETAVGYATLYGDMCGGYAPLK
ncbi:MAG: NAD+ synthase, partial [Proteobacteria bacterium]|nr:NAD+ synthase [Pseudomonadota bacterium]